VHGAVIAGVFDQVCNVANFGSGVPGPTRSLDVRYERPTLLGVPTRWEAWVESVEGREVTTRAHLLQQGEVTCRCVGSFVHLAGAASPAP
jgi:acyl-coenzyme A thioesterase PaaI-like protein